jgi:hypothetical protein
MSQQVEYLDRQDTSRDFHRTTAASAVRFSAPPWNISRPTIDRERTGGERTKCSGI